MSTQQADDRPMTVYFSNGVSIPMFADNVKVTEGGLLIVIDGAGMVVFIAASGVWSHVDATQ